MEKELYQYKGPVMSFDRCVCMSWEGQTYASSAKEAKRNLIYQYKKEHGLVANSNIKLSNTGTFNKV